MTSGVIPLSARVKRIKPSPSMVARQRAQALKAEGRDIVDLTIGEPDFDTPLHIQQATAAAMAAGETRYTPVNGTLRLRKAICAKLARENGVTYAPDEITVGSGAKQVIYNALAATLGDGDEVIVPAPYWVSYPDMVLACDGTPVIARLPEIDFIDDKAGKPLAIQKFIGRRPILAVGNSDGDFEMLQWTTAGSGARPFGAGGRRARSGHGDQKVEAPLDFVRQPGWLDPDQPGRPYLFEGKERSAHLARGRPRARLSTLEESALSILAIDF